MACACGHIRIGMVVTENRNWSPDCEVHGLHSGYWKSSEQVEKRRVQSERLRDLQARAAAARKAVLNA